MTTALEGGEGSASCPAALYTWERAGTHCTGGWVGPKAGMNRCRKSRPTGFDPRTIQPVAVTIPTMLRGPQIEDEAKQYKKALKKNTDRAVVGQMDDSSTKM